MWGGEGGGGLAPARLSKEVARNDKLTEKAEAHRKSSVKSYSTRINHRGEDFCQTLRVTL